MFRLFSTKPCLPACGNSGMEALHLCVALGRLEKTDPEMKLLFNMCPVLFRYMSCSLGRSRSSAKVGESPLPRFISSSHWRIAFLEHRFPRLELEFGGSLRVARESPPQRRRHPSATTATSTSDHERADRDPSGPPHTCCESPIRLDVLAPRGESNSPCWARSPSRSRSRSRIASDARPCPFLTPNAARRSPHNPPRGRITDSFVRLFVRSFIHLFVYSFACSLRLFIRLSVRSLARP
ncbi:hypothetical protein BJ875DRAFT_244595 [Amylocarpus encephaloides]|uniref:Uncharacterized protein n=1 Tax=Amylocarpus encephaloides TaxID=45428 RepID=A0A9P8C9T6_9HELO|nr:hypothetical protein BJ875DRAFT_244595 [Amylocarpus encephaloides]